ncbi:glycoside hydrolase family 19 protein [Paraburkholderia sp.]|uniref:glycoside hydrolase family 19 protein n=1 Tax=Paraburkholderia sp. TaxID=1926495 RepID=UPI0039E4D71B
MTPEVLAACLNAPMARARIWADPLSAAMALYSIEGPVCQAAFIAQVGHESGRLVYVRELWGPTKTQQLYEPQSEKATELGNTERGDGFRFRGRGLIQVTGRANYRRCANALGMDLISHPELLEEPGNASLSAAWFWTSHGLSQLAEQGDFTTITKRINGGVNGLQDRLALWKLAKAALGADDGT